MFDAFAIGFFTTLGALAAIGCVYVGYQLIAGFVLGAEEEEREEMK